MKTRNIELMTAEIDAHRAADLENPGGIVNADPLSLTVARYLSIWYK